MQRRLVGYWYVMNWKVSGRKRLWSYWDIVPAFACEWGKPQKCVPAEIRTKHFPNTTLQRYRLLMIYSHYVISQFSLRHLSSLRLILNIYTHRHIHIYIMWHICSRQELWNQQRQMLLGNGSANTPVAMNSFVTRNNRVTEKRCSLRGPCRGYIRSRVVGIWVSELQACVARGSNASIVVRGYNWATLFLGDINTGTWPSRLGEFPIWDSKIWSWVSLDSNPTMIALARASSSCKRQTRPLVREDAPHQQTRNCLTVLKIWSWAPDGARHEDRLAVGRNITLTLTCELVRQLKTTQFSSGAADERCQPARTGTIGHVNRRRYTVGSRYQATQWRPWLKTPVCDGDA
jgi:hypothetical protein